MPELPEVETVVRELRPRLVGRRIGRVHVSRKRLRLPWSTSWHRLVVGQRIREIGRRGKWIIVTLDREVRLVLHLGMTGQLTVAPATQPRLPHTHLIFELDGGEQEWRFRDVRRFGSARLFTTADEVERFFKAAALGPEPFVLRSAYWQARLAGTRRCLKAILLDQRVVAGVGNIYADEALFEAKLNPARLGHTLTTEEAQRLRKAIRKVLRRAIAKRGSSIRDYVGGNGVKGNFQNEFRVYDRTGKPCVRCEVPVSRLVMAGRSTHFCPSCQPRDP